MDQFLPLDLRQHAATLGAVSDAVIAQARALRALNQERRERLARAGSYSAAVQFRATPPGK